MRFGPLTFLLAVTGGWAAIRVAMLLPEEEATTSRKRGVPWRPALAQAAAGSAPVAPPSRNVPPPEIEHNIRRTMTAAPAPTTPSRLAMTDNVPPPSETVQPAVTPIQPPQPMAARPPSPGLRRFHVSGWAILRGTGLRGGLATAGQLGGSQAGMRARYDLGSGLAVVARLSGPLRERRGKEAAVALDWRPSGTLPVTFTVERRAGLDRGGWDAFATGVFGGVDAVKLPLGARLDGYAQAGMVGLRRRDLYVDGAARVERPILAVDTIRIGAGAGLWGGAQPGVSRIDIGPQIVAHMPIGPGSLRAGAEWRARLAGRARPGSGPVLSIGMEF